MVARSYTPDNSHGTIVHNMWRPDRGRSPCCQPSYLMQAVAHYRGGFRGSLLGSLEPPFLKLATYQQTLTELEDTHSSSLELRSAVQSCQIAQT